VFVTLLGASFRRRRSTGFGGISVIDPDDVRAAGVGRPVRFGCRRTLTIAVTYHGFIPLADGTPLIGRLPVTLHPRPEATRAMIRGEIQRGRQKPRRRCRPHRPGENQRIPLRRPNRSRRPAI
jgi:hypothetical protein